MKVYVKGAFCNAFRLRTLTVSSLSLGCLLIVGSLNASILAPILSSDQEVATAGYFRLGWETEAERVELQESNSQTFQNATTVYVGSDRNSVISGKPNGTWYYRVRALDAQTETWSDPVSVQVAHHDLTRALMFLSLGVIVFVFIVVVIVRGESGAK